MNNLIRDLRFSFKVLIKNPGFSLVAILTLALGLGVNSAVFSVVNAVLLRALPYQDAERLVILWERNTKVGTDHFPASYPDFNDYRDQSQVFDSTAAFRSEDFNLTGESEPERLEGAAVSPGFFSLLGVPAQYGHTFSNEEYQPGSGVVIISHGLWQRHFGANPNVTGQTLTLNEKSYTVVGVMPAKFRFPGELFERADLWIPLSLDPSEMSARGAHTLTVIARLKPGVALARAQSEVDTIALRLQQQFPDTNAAWGAQLVPLQEELVGDVKPALLILLGAVGFVLLIACVNVANLLLARATSRQKEIAIRMAIGASRWRIIQQLLTESLLLSVLGGVAGLLLGIWGVTLLQTLIPADYLHVQDIGLDAPVLGFTLFISVLTAVLFGLAPAWQATKLDIVSWLKEGSGKTTAGVQRRKLRHLLVVSEIALSLVLLIGASLLIKSFINLRQVDPGFRADNLLTVNVALSDSKYPDAPKQRGFFQQLLQQLYGTPGVESAGAVSNLPLGGSDRTRSFTVEGQSVSSSSQPTASYNAVSPDYFSTMGIPLHKGRAFTDRDADKSPMVAIINETLARRYFAGADPIGKHLVFKKSGQPFPREIVGVVGDVKAYGLNTEANPGVFVPYLQESVPAMTLVIRGHGNPLTLAGTVRGGVHSVDPYQPVDELQTMEQVVAQSISQQRLHMVLLSIFASVALLLATVGIYSVMSNAVRQRTQEIGIRIALGAQPGHILKMIVGNAMLLDLIGVCLGLLAALFLTRIIATMLYGVSTVDPLIFVGAPLLLSIVALVASFIPARRATRIDPIIALRDE